MVNPLGPDGMSMERHHPGRLRGPTELISKIEHDLIHESETNAVREIFERDKLGGNPRGWTGKHIEGPGI